MRLDPGGVKDNYHENAMYEILKELKYFLKCHWSLLWPYVTAWRNHITLRVTLSMEQSLETYVMLYCYRS